jgi:hypothetical protein
MIMKTKEEKLRILIYEPQKRIGQMQKFSSRYEIEKKNNNNINSNNININYAIYIILLLL